jgi:hypothetical protein
MLDKGIYQVRDDYCKLLKAFIWTNGDDERLFPKNCPLPKE